MRHVQKFSVDDLPDPLNVLGERVTVLAASSPSQPFEVHLQRGNQGGGPPRHCHPWDEGFYILEGSVQVTFDDSVETLAAGSYVHIPANTPHAYTNLSQTATLLGVVSDPRGGEFFAASDRHIRSLPEDEERLLSMGRELGVDFNPPAPA